MKLATIALAFSIIAASAAEPKTTAAPKGHASAWTGVKELVVVMQSASGSSCKGSVRFTQAGEKIKITADIEGLTPGQKHAANVHSEPGSNPSKICFAEGFPSEFSRRFNLCLPPRSKGG